ncbi:MAG: corrinoid protein [Oscillospiraceae bacterium]|jgi:corrinoid protein of di/trimethylamine methyltransferase|nr:corrinoid protein [Oscillospiraceae bacterium]
MRELFKRLSDAVLETDEDLAVEIAEEILAAGLNPQEAVEIALTDGMARAGELYEKEEYFIPELLGSADAMYAALEILKPHIPRGEGLKKHRVVIGSIEGDTHDIGKNIVALILDSAEFEVRDLGRDVPPKAFVEGAVEFNADIIAVSTLMTTTMERIGGVTALLEKKGLRGRFKVMVGGRPLSKAFADRIGADGYASDAAGALRLARKLTER